MPPVLAVVVLGGGVHGLAALWQLARLGAQRIALVERFRVGHAHGSSHGRTRITRSVYEQDLWVRLMRVAREEDWPRLERDAGERLVERCDGCFLGVGGETFGAYLRAVAEVDGIERLDVAQARQRFPQFRYDDVVGALHDRTAGVIHADATLAALLRLAREGGAKILEETRVLAIERTSDPIRLHTTRGELRAERLVVTAGAWTGALVPELRAELAPIRQTVAYYRLGGERAAQRIGRFPVWATLGDGLNEFHYGLPESAGEGVKLARHETAGRIDDPEELDVPPTAAELAHLDAVARARFAVPVEARLSSERCFYANTRDAGFRIDLLPDDARIAVAAACSGHGFKFAPLVGRALAGLVTNGTSGVDEFERARAAFRFRASPD